MNPISNQSFSHDYIKFVYQNPDVRVIHYGLYPAKPFKVDAPEGSEKTKKDLKKKQQ